MGKLPVALTIAGSDSGGGAGIQADLKSFQAMGVFGTTVITAITAQNTTGVTAVQGVDLDVVEKQLLAVLEDFPVDAAKCGMLFSEGIIRTIDRIWEQKGSKIPLVVDPVTVATSGARLLEESAEKALIDFLPRAALITPNIPEAEVILGYSLIDESKTIKAVKDLNRITGGAVLLKGGHRAKGTGGLSVDLFFDGIQMDRIEGPMLDSSNTHGTGCTLSATITALLASGMTLLEAVKEARLYLTGAIEHAPELGKGSGPLNHLWRS